MQPEMVHTLFLRWLNWLLQDSRWRAFIRTKVNEHELPVIDFTGKESGGKSSDQPLDALI